MYQEESHLTDADRRAIADIRRELDAEFGPLADDSVPDAFHRDDRDPSRRDDPDAYRRDDAHASRRHVRVPYQHADTPRSRRRSRARHRSTARRSRRGLVVAFVLGMLAGTGLGCVSMFLWQRRPPTEDVSVAPPARDPDGTSANARTAAPVNARDERASLQNTLDEWIAATARGDITTQMRFYPARVPVYYTWHDVPREAGGAVTRFHKRYVIEGPSVRRRGEMLQELRWMRTADGWVIVGERDVRVLATG